MDLVVCSGVVARVVDSPGYRPVLEVLEALFVEHVDAVFNVAFRVVWSQADAEDVVQLTFLKAVTRLDQLDDAGRVRPWLLQVSYREAIAVLRARREVPVDPEQLPDCSVAMGGPAELTVARDVVRILNAALGRMDPDERLAVVLRDVERLSMREVAEVLDVGLSAAKMRVHRGRASLRVLVTGEEVR